jgi:hypothetical protein
VRGSQSQLEEFAVGSAHFDIVDAVKHEGVAHGLVHQGSRAREPGGLCVDRHDGSLPREHRKSDPGLVFCSIGAALSQTSESAGRGEAENGRQNRERNDDVHVCLLDGWR